MDWEAANQSASLNQTENQADQLMMDDFWEIMLYMGLVVEKYYTPVLCFIGVLGNSLSLLVFLMDSKYRLQSSSYYLSALAVSDTGFLFSLFVVWLETIVGNLITFPIICPLVMYIGQVTCFVTVYLTVAFSVQRYVVVYYPLARAKHCTRSKAKLTICGIIALALLTFSYVWIIAEVVELELSVGLVDVCSVGERYYDISEIANYVDSTITLIIPFFVIAYFNLKTAIKVCELGRERRLITAASLIYNLANGGVKAVEKVKVKEIDLPKIQYGTRDCLQILKIPLAYVNTVRVLNEHVYIVQKKFIKQKYEYSDARVTKTLLLVSSVFLGLNLPLHVIRCTQFIQIARGSRFGAEILQGLQPWANMLFNTNFAVNMVLYCVFGKNFRKSLRNLLCRRKRK